MRVAVAVALILVGGCRERRVPPARLDAAGPPAPASPSAASAASPVEAGHAPDRPDAGGACDDATPRGGKSIGHTSVVFKLELTNGQKVAWKPNARKVRGRYRGEIAAYRLSEALGLTNVPLACFRVFDRTTVEAALATNPEAARVFADEAIADEGKVPGVVIPWIEGLQFWALEKEPLRSETRAWLRKNGPVPEDKMDLARQASTLVAFDFLTGNWDRYSGGNVGLDASGRTVLFIDNDAAFMDQPPKEQLARNRALLDGVDRFSRSLVARIRALDRPGLERALGQAGDRPLLPAGVVRAVADRAADLVSVVDAKIERNGERETLFFP